MTRASGYWMRIVFGLPRSSNTITRSRSSGEGGVRGGGFDLALWVTSPGPDLDVVGGFGFSVVTLCRRFTSRRRIAEARIGTLTVALPAFAALAYVVRRGRGTPGERRHRSPERECSP